MITELTVMKAKYGDDEAFAELYQDIYVDMYRTALYMLGDKNDAEDVVAETVLDIYSGISKLKKPKAFKSWAMKILWVKCKNKRGEYRNSLCELETEDEPVSQCDIEKDIVLKNDIEKAMECLTDDEKMIVVCSAICGMNSSQISDVTGLSRGTIRSKLSRALKKVRDRLEEYV